MKQGYLRARVDGELVELSKGFKLDRYKIHDIEVVIDRLAIEATSGKKGRKSDPGELQRIRQTIQTAMRLGKGSLMVMNYDKPKEVRHFSRHLMYPTSGISYPEAEPNLFSFNSPYGACSHCNGLGEVAEIDVKKIIPDPKKSIKKGGIATMGESKNNWIFQQVEAILKGYGADLNTPIEDLEEDAFNVILYGTEDLIQVEHSSGYTVPTKFEGVIAFIERISEEEASPGIKRWAESFMNKLPCPVCEGTRLKKEALFFKINDKNIIVINK